MDDEAVINYLFISRNKFVTIVLFAQPSLSAERLLPQMTAVEIVRRWVTSASPISRAKRNLPRVVVTKHFVNDDEFHQYPFANKESLTSHLFVQNNNPSASLKS